MPMRKDPGNDRYLNASTIGAILKARRESLGLRQLDVARALNYRNANYISMVEHGSTTISVARLPNVLKVYDMPKAFALVILKALYPDVFDMVFYVVEAASKMDFETATDEVIEQVKGYLKQYGLEPVEPTIDGNGGL
ncbi:MAG: helix-turn-helix domain-containing protein [Acidobacteriota bacterium]